MEAGCEIIRGTAATEGAQRLLYAPGVTSRTAAARGLCLTNAELPPGARSACHLHRRIESAGYVASGAVGLWWGERLEQYAMLRSGDFAYIPPDLPHVVGNVGSEPALIVVAHSSASDQDGIELLPELDGVATVTESLDGRIRSKDTIPPGNDPFPPRDREHLPA